MKKFSTCISILFLIAGMNSTLTAQPQYYNYTGAGNGSNSFPFNVVAGKNVQLLYRAGEFNQPTPAPAGNITSVSFFFNAGFGPATYTDMTIKLALSSITDLTSGAYYGGSMTTVYYRASVSLTTAASSWLTFTLDSPFPYDPTQSLIVDIGQCGATGTLGGTNAYTNLTGVRRVWSVGGCPFVAYASSSVYVYNMGINISSAPSGPTVVTTAATAVTSATATLNGTVNANGNSTAVTFDYGLTTAYGTNVPGVPSPVTGSVVTPVSAAITGLSPGTLYHFRVNGTNSNGSANGSDLTFTTPTPPPAVVTNPASNIGAATAQLNGTVTANNFSTAVSFNWGLTVAYGNTIAGVPTPVTGNVATAVLANIAGLTTGLTYHFRCVGVNAGGTTNGSDQSFTAGCTIPPAASGISGPGILCINSVGNVFGVNAVAGATSYTWTLPAGCVITSGAGTQYPTVTWGTVAGNVSVAGTNACGNGGPASMAVSLYPSPTPAITGTASGCQGFSATYTTQAGMTGYTWTVSAGGTITSGATTNTVNVTWNTAGAQTLSVNYANSNGCYAATPGSYAVTVNALPAITITGSTNLCVNSGYYAYSTQAGFTNYAWTVSAGGTISLGLGTNQVQVTWNQAGAQWVAVNYTNATGCSAPAPVQYPVTVNAVPGAAGPVTGTATLCAGTTGLAYSVGTVTNATSYVWTLPAGATNSTGDFTNSIIVDYALNASSGNITVYGNNLCGNGAASPGFPVTVNPKPSTPIVTSLGWIAYSSEPSGNQWYYSATWFGTGTPIPGATDSTYDGSLTGIGWYWSIVTLNACSSDSSNHKFVFWEGVDSHISAGFTISPVPSDGRFTVSMTSSSQETFTIQVFNNTGVMIYELYDIKVKGTVEQIIDLRPVANGICSVVIRNNDARIVKKVVISK
jgi:hypothetical protein